ncbi:(-)-alpha-amorphene synthase [Streptomyces sp. NPDC052701]|uniref:(-)-alpha-amorphene synthase n=1 Tax=Streptomyces sp. NPDC052701 TaxID=3155533 RepID=UPI003432FC9D
MSTTHEEITAGARGRTAALGLRELIDARIHMPFPFRSSPHESKAAAGVGEWLDAWGLTGEPGVAVMISRTRPAQLASYTSPTVDCDVLQIVANQIAYQFVFDDRAEELGRRRPDRLLPLLCESIEILRDGRRPTTALGAALADLYRQVRERCTPAQAARWASTSREYVHGLLYEAVAQSRPSPPRIGLVTSIRSLTAGVEPFYPLYEAAQNRDLIPEELHHPVMRRLRRLSVDAAVWTADLFSAAKEQRTGETINLALAHRYARRCSLPAAVVSAVGQINAAIREFEQLHAEFARQLSPSGTGYVEGMTGWISGCYHWSRTVPRYAEAAAAPALP